MPFTFSHPAIILPLARLNEKYISVSALVMGSMAPDFEYFIRMRLKQVHGHNLAGAFYFDLPVTLFALLIFHFLVRDTLIDHLPEFLRKKYAKFYQMNWFEYARKRWYVIIYSSLIGIFSHLFWDAFTHAPGYFVRYIPFLREKLLIFNVEIPSYDFMQLLSSGFGALIILTVILWPAGQKFSFSSYRKPLRYISMLICTAIIILVLRGADTQSEFIATSISGMLIGMILVPLFFRKFTVKRKIKV